MARLDQRLTEAADALASLEELTSNTDLSLAERDGAILRLVYTFEAVWKAAMPLLEASEGISVASPNATIRAARRVGWLSDPDAEAALRLAQDRNLTVHMYHKEIGEQIGSRLAAHAALLRRWLEALQRSAADV
jgi:hypothetical protein